jgi:hypothetical protein
MGDLDTPGNVHGRAAVQPLVAELLQRRSEDLLAALLDANPWSPNCLRT